jgi:archaellin
MAASHNLRGIKFVPNRSRAAYWLLLAASAVLFLRAAAVHAQTDDAFMPSAIRLAQTEQRETGAPASVILAQAILETGWGRQSGPGANNYFGIKASERPDGSINYGQIASGWTWAWTKEWDGAAYVDAHERFRAYQTMADSFRDLGDLYTQNARYAAALQQRADPREFARRIAQAGFATAPDYADRLIQLMDEQNLYQYDLKLDDAQFLDQSDYPTVTPGQAFVIYFEVKNSGLATWRQRDDYALANVNDSALGAQQRQAIKGEVAPEDTARWTIQMVAPSNLGIYRTEWRLKHGGQDFGPALYMDVTVTPPEADLDRVGKALLLIALLLGLVASGLRYMRRQVQAKA